MDVASGGELFAALRAGFPPERIYMHGNNKDAREIGEALDAGVGTIVVDNLDEIALLEREAAARGVRQRVLVRVTPGRQALDPLLHLHRAARLEVRASRSRAAPRPQAVAAVRAAPSLDLVGLHCHIGSQLFDLSSYPRRPRPSWPTSRRPCGGDDLGVMDMGGGLGIAYTRDDRPAAIEDYAEAVVEAVRARVGARRPADAARAGGARAQHRRPRRGHRLPGRRRQGDPRRAHLRRGGRRDERPAAADALRGGVRAAARQPGRRRAHRARCAWWASTARAATCSWARRPCRPSAPGDLVCLPATGAYGVSMASNYNGVTRPAVVFVDRGARPPRDPPRDLRRPGRAGRLMADRPDGRPVAHRPARLRHRGPGRGADR